MGFTDDRRFLWAGRLDDNKIFVFDMSRPEKPRLTKTITNLVAKTGFVGPHTFYAMPGRMLVQALSNAKDHGGQTGLVMFNNKGDIIEKYPMPTTDIGGTQGDGQLVAAESAEARIAARRQRCRASQQADHQHPELQRLADIAAHSSMPP